MSHPVDTGPGACAAGDTGCDRRSAAVVGEPCGVRGGSEVVPVNVLISGDEIGGINAPGTVDGTGGAGAGVAGARGEGTPMNVLPCGPETAARSAGVVVEPCGVRGGSDVVPVNVLISGDEIGGISAPGTVDGAAIGGGGVGCAGARTSGGVEPWIVDGPCPVYTGAGAGAGSDGIVAAIFASSGGNAGPRGANGDCPIIVALSDGAGFGAACAGVGANGDGAVGVACEYGVGIAAGDGALVGVVAGAETAGVGYGGVVVGECAPMLVAFGEKATGGGGVGDAGRCAGVGANCGGNVVDDPPILVAFGENGVGAFGAATAGVGPTLAFGGGGVGEAGRGAGVGANCGGSVVDGPKGDCPIIVVLSGAADVVGALVGPAAFGAATGGGGVGEAGRTTGDGAPIIVMLLRAGAGCVDGGEVGGRPATGDCVPRSVSLIGSVDAAMSCCVVSGLAGATFSVGVPSAGHQRTSSVYGTWQRGQRFIDLDLESRKLPH